MATIIGRGLLAKELEKRYLPPGVYYFSGVSSNVSLSEDFDTKLRKQINEFIDVLIRCRDNKDLLIYASSSLAYQDTPYGHLKGIMEELVKAYNIPSLGVSLPVVYGAEAHKGTSASVVYQWTKLMQEGKSPLIFGDGTQTRDFMYIDDAIDQVIAHVKERGIISIGTGIKTSFNEVVETINTVLGTDIQPIYASKPKKYVEEIDCTPVPFKVSLAEGIKKILCEK